jgi:hypothetical protein
MLASEESKETAQSSPAAANPFKNPSYPERVHFAERKTLEERLRYWEEKILAMGKTLTAQGDHPQRDAYVRLFHQMQGARDQMAEAVRRMPLETGALYDEDRERLTNAEAALTRILQRWDAVKA